jgi:hypothetical protein
LLRDKPDPFRAAVEQQMKRWQHEPDLQSLREPRSLEALTASEKAGWRTFWADVEALRQLSTAK